MSDKKAPCRVLFLLFSDIQQSHDRGAENDVGKKLKHEIEANKENDQIRTDRHVFSRRACVYGIHKECEASQDEDARVDNGADDCGNDDGEVTVELFKRLINDTSEQPREKSLYQNGDDRSVNAETKPERRVGRHEEYGTRNNAEPCTRKRATQGRAQYDGNEGKRDGGETADPNKSAQISKDGNQCREQSQQSQSLCGHSLSIDGFHKSSL